MSTAVIVEDALDRALAEHVMHLFEGLAAASDLEEGYQRFEAGLKKAVEAYDYVRQELDDK